MLGAYPLLHTRSIDEVVAYIEDVTGLSLSQVGRAAPGGTAVNGLWLKRLSFASFRYSFGAPSARPRRPRCAAAGARADARSGAPAA